MDKLKFPYNPFIPNVENERGQPVLECPICGSIKMAPTSNQCFPIGENGGVVEIDAQGLRVNPGWEPHGCTIIHLTFVCEAFHITNYEFKYDQERNETVIWHSLLNGGKFASYLHPIGGPKLKTPQLPLER